MNLLCSRGNDSAKHLFLGCLLGSLGDLASLVNLDDGLDDTDGNGLTHITDGKTTKRWVLGKSLNAHWLRWNHLDNGSITRLDELWRRFDGLASTTINLLEKFSKLASNVGSVAIEDRSVPSSNLTRVVEDNDLGVERFGTLWWIVLGVTANVSTTNFLDRDVLDVETNVVTWKTFDELFVVHFDGLDFSGNTSWGKGDNHTGLDGTGFDTSDWHSSNTTNLVHILKWETKRLVDWTAWLFNGINGFQEGLARGLASLGFLIPTLVPWAVGR